MKSILMLMPVLALGLSGCNTQQVARMSLSEAEAICTKRATAYAETPILRPDASGTLQVGLQAETPDSFMVGDYYRSCMYANAGVRLRMSEVPNIPVYN